MQGRSLLKILYFLAGLLCGSAGFAVSAGAFPYVSALSHDGLLAFSERDYQDPFIKVSDDDSRMGKGAEAFIGEMARKGIGFLGNESMTETQKKAAFKKLLQDIFDMKTIGRFSLGRYWRASSPQQRDEYLALFEKMIINVYSQRFSDYQGQRFKTAGFRTDGSKDTIVTSFIVPVEGPEVQVDWRVRYKNGAYKVIDVIVEGVSMSVTQRADFSAVIQRGGGNVQVLLAHLKSK